MTVGCAVGCAVGFAERTGFHRPNQKPKKSKSVDVEGWYIKTGDSSFPLQTFKAEGTRWRAFLFLFADAQERPRLI